MAFEALNFKEYDDPNDDQDEPTQVYLGYVQPSGDGINLTQLGGTKADRKLGNTTVVWVATEPQKGGQWIIGWYEDATVFAEMQFSAGRKIQNENIGYLAVGPIKSARLLDEVEREHHILSAKQEPKNIGQANI